MTTQFRLIFAALWLGLSFGLVAATTTQQSPIRIMTLSPHLAEWVDAAGASSALVAVSRFTNYPRYTLGLPTISDVQQLFIEKILSLKPTHILAWKEGTPKQHIDKLKQLNLPVIVLSSHHLADIPAGIETIQRLTNSSAKHINLALPKPSHTAPTSTIFIEVWSKPLMTLGASHFLIEALNSCGLVTIFPELNAASVSVSPEAVVSARPDIWLGFSSNKKIKLLEHTNTSIHWQPFLQLPFVQQHRSFLLNADIFSRPTPRMLAAIPALCQQLQTLTPHSVLKSKTK